MQFIGKAKKKKKTQQVHHLDIWTNFIQWELLTEDMVAVVLDFL